MYIPMDFMLMRSLHFPIAFGGIGVLTPSVEAGASALVRLTTVGAEDTIPVIGAEASVVGMVAAGEAAGDIITTEVIIRAGVAVAATGPAIKSIPTVARRALSIVAVVRALLSDKKVDLVAAVVHPADVL